jgi:hypothetical protein
MAEDFGCSDCAKKKTFHINKALDEMTDEEWNQAFPTFTGKRAEVWVDCESCT